jgi:putative transposase
MPKAKRAAAQWVAERFGLSERRVCRIVPLDRNTLRYHSRRQEDAALQTRIREIAEAKRRYGCPRIYVRLRREGWLVNHKKVERLHYREERLSLRRRRRKKACGGAPGSPCRSRRNQDGVTRSTLSMTGWPMADGSSA